MKLVVGLGNPGEKYVNTRHNVGFMIVDVLASQMVNGQWLMVKKLQSLIINNQSLTILAKPQTFMNSSGDAVKALATFYRLPATNIWVIHDDLDLTLGNYKIQKGKGPREHNGLNSIYKSIGTQDFWHVRVGIDNRKAAGPEEPLARRGEEYVLQNFTTNELTSLENVISNVANDLLTRLEK